MCPLPGEQSGLHQLDHTQWEGCIHMCAVLEVEDEMLSDAGPCFGELCISTASAGEVQDAGLG